MTAKLITRSRLMRGLSSDPTGVAAGHELVNSSEHITTFVCGVTDYDIHK